MRPAKRAADVLFSLLGLALVWPVVLAAAITIKLEDGGDVLFRQPRVGRRGRIFRIWKLRTMVADAERRGSAITVGRDPRITRVGGWLRRAKLDELPQLLNVLRGEMSLVGPRPEVPRYVQHYTAEQRRILELRPGITDPASLDHIDESALLAGASDPERTYLEEILPTKLRLSAEYAARATLWSDLGVILRTLAACVTPARRAGRTAIDRRAPDSA